MNDQMLFFAGIGLGTIANGIVLAICTLALRHNERERSR